MADYNIFILITKKYLQAGYCHNAGITPISIDGNLKITYSSDKDFDKLLDAIRDTFNIDELDDISLSTLIISCGTNRQNSDHLYSMMKKTTTHNLINAEIIIPYLCIYKTKLKQDQELCVSLLDSNYLISKQTNGKFKCILLDDNNEEKSLLKLDINDLLPLVDLDLSKIGIDEKVINEKDNRIQQLEKELNHYKDYSAKLEEENLKLQKEVSSLYTINNYIPNEEKSASSELLVYYYEKKKELMNIIKVAETQYKPTINFGSFDNEKILSTISILTSAGLGVTGLGAVGLSYLLNSKEKEEKNNELVKKYEEISEINRKLLKEEIEKAKEYIEKQENNTLPSTELDNYLIKNIKIMDEHLSTIQKLSSS